MLAVSTAYVIPESRQEATEKLVMEGHACIILLHADFSRPFLPFGTSNDQYHGLYAHSGQFELALNHELK
jgi:hypothetical protein